MSGRVLVVGDVMTDVIVVPEGPLARGSDRRARIRSLPGGSGANQAVWLGALGADVRLVARVGAVDKVGLEAYFRSWGVEPLLTGDSEAASGALVTIVDPDGERSFLTDRGANLSLSADDVPPSLLDDTAVLVLSGYSFFVPGPRQAVMGLMKEALARKIPIVIDPASEAFLRESGTSNFLDWTSGASLLFANYDEAFALSGVPDVETQMLILGAHYERVVLKRGALGASLGDAKGIKLSAVAPQVEVVDTTGAGDAFVGGFIVAMLRDDDEAACLAAGIAAGSEAVQQIGGQPQRH